mgnify:FL=1
MSKYSEIKKGIKPKYARGGKCYAAGGRVGESAGVSASAPRKSPGGKTIVNVIVPSSPGAAPGAGAAGPVAPMPMPSGPGAPPQPVPPAAAAMAMQQMSGKPPGAFAHGGRVKGKQLTNASGGAGGGKGRLRKVVIQK